MISRSLDYLVARAARLADVTIGASGVRHLTADVESDVNAAYRQYQANLIAAGFDLFTLETSPAALPSSPETGEDYSLVDIPTGTASIKRVDVLVDSEWVEAEAVEWGQIRQFTRQNWDTHRRIGFSVRSMGTVSGSTEGVGTMAIAPFVTGTYRISYLPEQPDITTGTDVFRFQSEDGAKWVICEVASQLAIRDHNQHGNYDRIVAERSRAKAHIGTAIPAVVSTGSTTTVRSRNYR